MIMENTQEVLVSVQPTPNPNALKFITNVTMKNSGKSSYRDLKDCDYNPLAFALMEIRGIDQLLFTQNYITVSKFGFEDWSNIEDQIIKIIKDKAITHDPEFKEHDPEKTKREALPADLREIEEILDRTIRPGLQADGGDLECLSFQENILMIRYHGACGTCPSSSSGTLEAIRNILREQFSEQIEVFSAPQEFSI